MAFRVLIRRTGDADFTIGPSRANTGTAGFQDDLRDAVKDPTVTDIIIMNDGVTDAGRFVPWALRLNGRPG